jgi:F-type H+-transporting ATPase subunit c
MRKLVSSMMTFVSLMLLATPAFAQGADSIGAGILAIGAGACIGLAAFGGARSQGRAASAALEGIARNPQAAPRIQTPMIIALALTESLVLHAFVIAFFLQGKIG